MRIGVVGDIHLPFEHSEYLHFCSDTFEEWGVDHVHFAGDVVDAHAWSDYDHDPDGHSASREAELAAAALGRWYERFPRATVSIGNHDHRIYRAARRVGLPSQFVRSYADLWDTPGWDWQFTHILDDVVLEHGSGSSGKDAAINRAIQLRSSCAIGHIHCHGGVKYHTNDFDRVFGLNAGCGVDCSAYAFEYGRAFPIRPTLGCGVILDGVQAYFEIMPCGPKEKYKKRKRTRKYA